MQNKSCASPYKRGPGISGAIQFSELNSRAAVLLASIALWLCADRREKRVAEGAGEAAGKVLKFFP